MSEEEIIIHLNKIIRIQIQRFVMPLWRKDTRGGIYFSSTATFLKFENKFFCIFTNHALEKETSLENIGFLHTDGCFKPLSGIRDFKIYHEYDIVICCFSDKALDEFSEKNFFDLSCRKQPSDFQQENLIFIGFPATNTARIYRKVQVDNNAITDDIVKYPDGSGKWKNAKYFMAGGKNIEDDGIYITSNVPRKNQSKTENSKSMAPNFTGMSGGALFQIPKGGINISKPLEDSFYFRGMAIEYPETGVSKGILKGISRNKIIELLNDFLSSSNENK